MFPCKVESLQKSKFAKVKCCHSQLPRIRRVPAFKNAVRLKKKKKTNATYLKNDCFSRMHAKRKSKRLQSRKFPKRKSNSLAKRKSKSLQSRKFPKRKSKVWQHENRKVSKTKLDDASVRSGPSGVRQPWHAMNISNLGAKHCIKNMYFILFFAISRVCSLFCFSRDRARRASRAKKNKNKQTSIATYRCKVDV